MIRRHSLSRALLAATLFTCACGNGNNETTNNTTQNNTTNTTGTNNTGTNNTTNTTGTNNTTNTTGTNNTTNTTGTNNTTNTTGTNNTTGTMTSMLIVAADGGRVELEGASLEIPPNALAADTTITLAANMPDANTPNQVDVAGMVYNFGPDGTQFLLPATLRMPSEGPPSAGKEKVAVWQSGAAWVPLGSALIGTDVVASIRHFTNFAVLEANADCNFSACGGDPTGTWTVGGICAGFAPEDNGLCPAMDGWTVRTNHSTGTVTFNGDNTFTQDYDFVIGGDTWFPPACLDFIETASGTLDLTDCETLTAGLKTEVFGTDADAACTGSRATGCMCSYAGVGMPIQASGTWSVSGTTLTVDTGQATVDSPFCVAGNVLQQDGRAFNFGVSTWVK